MRIADELVILICARKIIKEKSVPRDIDVSVICDVVGISLKTGYQREIKLDPIKSLIKFFKNAKLAK